MLCDAVRKCASCSALRVLSCRGQRVSTPTCYVIMLHAVCDMSILLSFVGTGRWRDPINQCLREILELDYVTHLRPSCQGEVKA